MSGAYQGLYTDLAGVPRGAAKLAVEGVAWYDKNVEGLPAPKADDVYTLFGKTGPDDLRISANEKETTRASEAAGKANEEVARANERAAGLEKEAAAAKLALEKLRSQLAGRRISKEQHDLLVSLLESTPTQVSVTHPDDAEAALFAADIAQALRDAGWTVSEATGFWIQPPIGLIVSHVSQTSLETAHPLARALKEAKIGVTIIPGDAELKLTVGVKKASL